MRLTVDLINLSLSYLNPLKERELDLRGHKIPAIENLGVAKDHDAIDLTDNDINSLSNFPLSPRLHSLYLARNRVAHIQPSLPSSIPNLTTLVLTANHIAELADLDSLSGFRKLTHLILMENPVSRKEIMGIKSRTFDLPSAGITDGTANGAATTSFGGKQYRVRMTEEEKRRVEELIRNAKSLQEITRLEKELAEGRIPGGVSGAGGGKRAKAAASGGDRMEE
ncbi:MAG: alpha 1,2-mannosyltransferase 2.4.1 [Chaenotheca gracillima]|nr:MAG: alpha 1,2-mannosyltransferase 2.4.1 [Chaenotheca gracillima]